MHPLRYLFALPLFVFLLGCGGGDSRPKSVPVSGTIKYRKTEIPVGALVVLHPKDASFEKKIGGKPQGRVAEDGSFKLTTHETDDGAPPGEYGVTVEWRPKLKETKFSLGGEGGAVAPNKLNPKFSDPRQPFKTVSITDGANKLELEVE
jgi:hypothetical protein